MTTTERKLIIVRSIREIENKLVSLRFGEYDGYKSLPERDAEIEEFQRHLHSAHSHLVCINEEELLGVA